MEEATADLRNAIHLALSLGEPHGSNEDRGNNNIGDDLLNNDVAAHHHHGSSEGTYISSLSGSLPSDRSNALASRRKNYYAAMEDHNDNHNNHVGAVGGRHVWQKRRLHVASCLENAVSNYEVAVFNYHTGNDALSSPVNGLGGEQHRDFGNTNNGTHDIIDLLVALLTSVPRILLEQTYMQETNIHSPPQEDESYMSSIEQVCYNAACIASDMIQKYFQTCTLNNMDDPPMLEESHVHDLIAEVVHICNTDPAMIVWSNVDPIVRILNSLSEERDIERSMQERDHGYSEDNGYNTIYSILSFAKDTLQLFHTLLFRYLCDQEDENTEPSNHVGYFISYLLEHFSSAVALDMGYTCPEEATDPLFEAWADAVDEQLVPRLNGEEARDVHDLVVRYHVGSIQSTLQLIENAESAISHVISASEQNSGVEVSGTTLESIITALQDVTRHMAMVVATTEVMDKLSLQHDPEIHTIFHPLMASYARFTASYLHDAMQFLRETCDSAHEYEETSILADHLLFRICRVSLGVEFLKSLIASTGDEEEVLAIALLRASSSQCIAGKARFLLEIAADRASGSSKESAGAGSEPTFKRQRFNSGKSGQTLRNYIDNRQSPTEDSHGEEMSDIILACLALSRSNQGDLQSTVEKAACLSSALMSTEEDGTSAVIDPLNPWHTLQIKPMAKLAALVPPSPRDGGVAGAARDNLLSYINSTPHLFGTSTSGSSLQS